MSNSEACASDCRWRHCINGICYDSRWIESCEHCKIVIDTVKWVITQKLCQCHNITNK
jgi:hypothetical protein